MQKQKENFHIWSGALGSGIGAMFGSLFRHPLETVSTNSFHNKTSFLQALKTGYRASGVGYLYRGYVPNLMTVIPSRMTMMFTYYSLLRLLEDHAGFKHQYAGSISAMASGVALALVLCPAEVIKSERQLSLQSRTDLPLSFRRYYRGLVPLIGRTTPTNFFVISFAEYLRNLFNTDNSGKFVDLFSSVLIAAVFSQTIAIPYENVRIRKISTKTQASSTEIIKQILKEGSVRLLYRGFFPRTVGFAIHSAFTIGGSMYLASKP